MNTNTALPKPLPSFISDRLDTYLHQHIECRSNAQHLVHGLEPNKADIVLRSNDYLAVSNHPSIKQAQLESIENAEHEIVMSAVFEQKYTAEEESFEYQLSQYTGFENCIVTQSGWAANVGLLHTIANESTPIYIDFYAHMSLWHGAENAKAPVHSFMHNKIHHLKKLLELHGPGIIIVDSVYSTIGTVSPLREVVALGNLHGCAIIVDESHSLGTHGPHGSGLVAELGLTSKVDFVTVSLAKAFAYRAGAILCHEKMQRWLPFTSLPAIFSSALLPHELETLKATLSLIKSSDERRNKLFKQATHLKQGLEALGYRVQSQSQIIAIETGTEEKTEQVRDYFEKHGLFGSVFCHPATPKNRAIIRLSLNSGVSDRDIDNILTICSQAKSEGVM
ncbi:alpha-hydroxyketone-type quorum-sensing autoinducer synthase [Vibrio sp. SCSIO 43136]|uniref:alpha-hydroxyketone-type quorum-sensing autoinducer synthase n=1 Tax=Vibrio sp. SCSIO 43136 TaxID=2819101 RepID=UPI00207576BF|nr:alpha-hydroxyketone-type quorum-sensing autoinducer synthase [Vibrio sp. SCSIO 43136]USD68194.1 quorum-sensing autoinducer CAI-1 synthase [Vibrio sp. SCSIO 43136]